MYEILLLAFVVLSLINAYTDFKAYKTADLITSGLWFIVFLLSSESSHILAGTFAILLFINSLYRLFGWGDILFLPAHFGLAFYIGDYIGILLWLFVLSILSLIFCGVRSTTRVPVALPSFGASLLFIIWQLCF